MAKLDLRVGEYRSLVPVVVYCWLRNKGEITTTAVSILDRLQCSCYRSFRLLQHCLFLGDMERYVPQRRLFRIFKIIDDRHTRRHSGILMFHLFITYLSDCLTVDAMFFTLNRNTLN